MARALVAVFCGLLVGRFIRADETSRSAAAPVAAVHEGDHELAALTGTERLGQMLVDIIVRQSEIDTALYRRGPDG
jgi:hypothetical protein